jgi:hypothetical protein
MKILRLQVPRNLIESFGLQNMFKDVNRLEIINAYQYDQQNFFSMQRIVFSLGFLKDMDPTNLESLMRRKFNATFFDLMDKQEDSILCIMKQNRKEGFWLFFEPGPWAFVFPINVDEESIILSVFIKEEYINTIKDLLQKLTQKSEGYEVLAQSTTKSLEDLEGLGMPSLSYPNFSERQMQIATFAARKGYFESPKKISAEEIASNFGITVSAVNENLRKAEHLSMKYFFGTKRD